MQIVFLYISEQLWLRAFLNGQHSNQTFQCLNLWATISLLLKSASDFGAIVRGRPASWCDSQVSTNLWSCIFKSEHSDPPSEGFKQISGLLTPFYVCFYSNNNSNICIRTKKHLYMQADVYNHFSRKKKYWLGLSFVCLQKKKPHCALGESYPISQMTSMRKTWAKWNLKWQSRATGSRRKWTEVIPFSLKIANGERGEAAGARKMRG